ncbi:MAG TPA: hypothetical protein VD837_10225 [Terriglobales bacterium]|nr:hypothetical protein [Terriglobales bacterium]
MTRHCDRRNIRRFFIFALLLAMVAVVPASARTNDEKQATKKEYALIFGTVWTPDKHPGRGVKVKIRRADQKKAKWELVSDRNGEFAQRVPPGPADYVVWAEVPNKKGIAAETKVHIDHDERIDIGLHLTE